MPPLFKVVLVFLGGGLGSLCRYGIALLIAPYQATFPLGTWVANVISCFILGMLIALKADHQISTTNQLLFITGFCGGFSTFSTFTGETLALFQSGHTSMAFANIFVSLLVCTLSMLLGIKLVGLI